MSCASVLDCILRGCSSPCSQCSMRHFGSSKINKRIQTIMPSASSTIFLCSGVNHNVHVHFLCNLGTRASDKIIFRSCFRGVGPTGIHVDMETTLWVICCRICINWHRFCNYMYMSSQVYFMTFTYFSTYMQSVLKYVAQCEHNFVRQICPPPPPLMLCSCLVPVWERVITSPTISRPLAFDDLSRPVNCIR